MSDATSNNSADYVLLTRLADEFAARYRAGERPALKEYTDRYPHLADEIHDLFPAMVEIEQVKDDHQHDAELASAPEFPALQQVGDFRIIREVGKGGMGIVYEAEQVSLGRHVALKVLPKSMLLDAKAKRRFEREAKSAAKLHHTNIVPVFGVGEQDGMPYYVMQFIQGLGLDEVLDELKKLQFGNVQTGTVTGGRLRASRKEVSAVNVARSLMTGDFQWTNGESDENTTPIAVDVAPKNDHTATAPPLRSPSDSFTLSSSSVVLPGQRRNGSKAKGRRKSYWRSVATIGVQVADALEYAHKQGVHHRDVKPSNLLLDTQATVWVTDFGLAKANDQQNLTHTGDILGTLRYMPPEAFEGKTDARSDVYSLGLTLYELLAFRPAFDEKERNRLIKQVTNEVAVPLRKLNRQVPQDLETIVHKAIDKDPKERYATAGDLAEDLQRFIEDEPIKARRVSPAERAWRWCKRNPALSAASAIAAAGLVAVTVFAVLFALVQSRSNAALLAEQRQTRAEKDRAQQLLEKSEKLSADLSSALNETKKQEAMLVVEKGHALIGQGQLYPGMLWLARGLESAPADAVSLQDSIRMSLAALGREVPVLREVFTATDGKAAALSPDGKTIVIGGWDATCRLWDAATGKPLGLTLPHEYSINDLAYSPDGQSILTGSGTYQPTQGQGRLWDAKTGKPRGAPLPHPAMVWAVAYSPDGKTIVTGTVDEQAGKGEIRLWDAATGEPRGQAIPQVGPVYALAFCPDGNALVTACYVSLKRTSEIRLWDPTTGKTIGQPRTVNGPVECVVPSPDGKTIVTGGSDFRTKKGEAQFWDRATLAPLGQPLPRAGVVCSACFSPDGRLLVTGSGDYASKKGETQIWETATGKRLGAPLNQPSGAVWHVSFSPDGRTILTRGINQPCTLWERPTNRLIGPLLVHQDRVSAVAVSPDGKMIVAGTGTHQKKKGPAQRWDAATGKPIGPPLPQPGHVTSVAFSHDGTRLVTGTCTSSGRGDATIWDAATGESLGIRVTHSDDVVAVAFSPDGRRIVTGSMDKTARLWDAASGQPVGEALAHSATVACVAYSPDGALILTGSGQQARLWDASTGKPRCAPLEHQGAVLSVNFSPGGETFVTAGRQLLLWDALTAKLLGLTFDIPDGVTAVVFSPDGKLVVTGSPDGTARVWDARTGLPVGASLRHPKPVTSVAITPDGQTIVTGCDDGIVRCWDTATRVTGENARLVRSVEVASGLELSPERSIRPLDEATLRERRDSLAKLGGPLPAPAGPLSWHTRQALESIDAGDWRAAAWHLDRQIHDHPQDALAYTLRTRVDVELDRLDLAAADFGQAMALGPPECVLASIQACATEAIEKKRGPRALWYLNCLIAAQPDSAFGWLARGGLAAEQAQWKNAAGDMARGIDLDISGIWDWYHAIPLQLYTGELATYRRLCHTVLMRLADTDSPVLAERIVKLCLLVPDTAEDRRLLSQLADRAVRLGASSNLLPYFEFAKGLAEYRDGRFQSAVNWLTKSPMYTQWSKELPAQSFLALSYHRLGHTVHARQAMDQARQIYGQLPEPGPESMAVGGFHDWIIAQLTYREAAAVLDVPHRREADACLHKRQWSEAAQNLDHLIKADPSFWPDWVSRSCALAEQGRQADADADFAHALALVPDQPHPWLKRGRFQGELGRPDKAAVDFARGLELMPESPDWETERTAVLGELLAQESVFARVMALCPKDPGFALARARFHVKQKAWEKALPDYTRAAALKPGDMGFRLERGRCLAFLNRFDEAASDYANGLEPGPDDVVYWSEAAMAQLAAGKIDDYRRICSRLLDRYGHTESADVVSRVVYALAQAPSSVPDMTPVVHLAEKYDSDFPGKGAALYRAGKLDQAIRELDRSAWKLTPFRQSWCWLYVAMAHHRLGHAAEARQFLEKVQRSIKTTGQNEKDETDWVPRIAFQLLRREADELLREKVSTEVR